MSPHYTPPKRSRGQRIGYCTHEKHKLSYASRAEAKRAIRRLQSKGYSAQSEYRCPTCGDWHLTSEAS